MMEQVSPSSVFPPGTIRLSPDASRYTPKIDTAIAPMSTSDLCSPNIKSEYLINDGDVIFSWSGTLWLDLWCSGLCGLNQHLFKVTSEKFDKWFFYFWTKYHLNKFVAIATDKEKTKHKKSKNFRIENIYKQDYRNNKSELF